MIDLNRPSIQSDGLTFFGETADSNAWSFLPERPRIQRTLEGEPALRLIKYRGDLSLDGPPAGGLLSLAVELDASASALDRGVSVLRQAQRDGFPMVVPLHADRVTCELQLSSASGDSDSIVSRELAVNFPHAASFEVPLTREGALMFEHALQSGLSPGVVRYRFDAAVRRPALPAKITVDWRRTLEFFTQQSAMDEPFLLAQITSGVERLLETGIIRLELLPTTTGLEPFVAIQQKAVDETVALVVKELFELGPAIVDAAPVAAAGDGVDPQSPKRVNLGSQAYRLRLSGRELGTATYDLGQPREDTLVLTAAATLNTMLEGVNIARLVVETDEPPAPASRAT